LASSIDAPISISVDETGTRRVHQHVLDDYVGAGNDKRGDQRKRGRRGIARHEDRLSGELALALYADTADAFTVGFDLDLGTETGKHFLRMVARHDRLDDRGDAGRVQPRQQHRRLHLRRRHGDPIGYGRCMPGTPQGDRHAIAGGRLDLNAHLAQRIEHALHRPAGERGIADERRPHVVDSREPHRQARTGAGIAEIEWRTRFKQAAVSHAADDPLATGPVDPRTEGTHRFAGPENILPFQQPGYAGFAGRYSPEHQRPVRDRLVARHAHRSRKRSGAPRGSGAGLGAGAHRRATPALAGHCRGGLVACRTGRVIPLRRARRKRAARSPICL
jgi:hypothetical protein